MKKAIGGEGMLAKISQNLNFKNMNLPARSSLFFTLSNLLCKGAAFLFTPIFTRLLSSSDYGEYSLFSTLLSLSAVIVTMEIPGGIIMRLYQKEKDRRFLSTASAAFISFFAATPTVLVLWLINRLGGFGMSFPFAYVFLFISLISISIINLYVTRCKFLYRWIPPLIISLMQSIAAPIISIALLRTNYLSGLNHVSVKIGAVSTVLFAVAVFISAITVKNAASESKAIGTSAKNTLAYIKEAIKFLLKLALPLLPYYISIILISQADKLFISALLGKEALAKYSVAYSAGVALTALTGGVMGALSPWLMRKARAGEYDKIRAVLNRIISASIPAIVIFLCLAPEFFSFLAPEEYQSALPVLFISAIIPIPLALAQCSSSIAIAQEKVGGVLLSGIVPAILTVALDFLIIKVAPLYAPAIITASGFLILSAIGIANIRKITGNFTVNVNKAFQNLLFLITLAAVVYVFRPYMPVRAAIALLSAVSLTAMAKPLCALLGEESDNTTRYKKHHDV